MVSDRPGPWTVGYSSLRILIEGTDWRVNCSKRHSLHFVWQRESFCAWFAWSFAPAMRYFVGFYSLLLQSIWWSWIFSMQIFSSNIISEFVRITTNFGHNFWSFPIFRLWPSLQWWFNVHFYQTANFFHFMTGMAQANIRNQLRQMYRIYKLISDNAHGNIKGLTGSLTSSCLLDVLNALHVTGQGRRIFDCGAADGKVLAAALILGSEGAHGFELPENAANRFIFQSVLNRIIPLFDLNQHALQRTHLQFTDISNVSSCSVFFAYISFWNRSGAGRDFPSWFYKCLFFLGWHGVHWSSRNSSSLFNLWFDWWSGGFPRQKMEITSRRCFLLFGFLLVRYLIYLKTVLRQLLVEEAFNRTWFLSNVFRTRMQCSSEQHTCWVFRI